VNDALPLLALLHPAGRARGVDATATGGPLPPGAELVAARFGRRGLAGKDAERFLAEVSARLAPDGLLCIEIEGWRASQLERTLRSHNLIVEATYVRVATRPARIALVPLEPLLIRQALARRLVRGRLADAALARLGRRGTSLLTRVLPRVLVVARRRGAAPTLAWIAPGAPVAPRALLASSWRGPAESVLLDVTYVDGEHRVPHRRLTAKLSLRPEADEATLAEAAALRELVPDALKAGVRAPTLLGLTHAGDRAVLLEETLAGIPARHVLRARPVRLGEICLSLASWLERWSASTRAETHDLAALIEPRLEASPLEAGLVADVLARLRGVRVPTVAVHGDLTMSNVLVSGHSLAVVDWRQARRHGAPVGDLVYMLVDAVLATGRVRDRVAAFAACFARPGPHARRCDVAVARLAGRLGLTPDQVECAALAAWAEHAANEAASAPTSSRPFHAILLRALQPSSTIEP